MSRYRIACLTLLASFSGFLVSDEPARDFKDQLPRIAPLTPAEALKSFRLRSGFHMELVAAEPLLTNPVAIDFDENGRMFVAEYPEYNQQTNPHFKRRGLIRMLEDSKGDGNYDKSTIYAADLDAPVAVACYDGGIFVGSVPDIVYLKDTKKDGKADVRTKVFTGFARDVAGEAMFNSFRWGLDDRFHLSTSAAGGLVKRVDEVKMKPVNVRGEGFLFDPHTHRFELTSGGGQHGMSMDDWGRTFVCANSDPMHMVMYDARYLKRNPYLSAPAPAVNILPTGRTTKLFRISPVEPWRVLRTRLRKEKIVAGPDEGGEPAGYFTSATGITVYRGDAWPGEYKGNLLVGEVAGNMVFRATVEPDGVGLKAKRADAGVEFLASSDIWFRPVQFANAPDGCLYVLDMYRELIETTVSLPPQILKHLDVSAGLDKGRIYRIVPDNFKRRQTRKLGSMTTEELVALLEHPNGWHRDTAARLLYQRQDKSAIASLQKLAAQSKSPLGRLHALWALAGLGALDERVVVHGLDDPEPRVREHTVRLAERFNGNPDMRARVVKMVADPDTRVRYQLAFSLGEVTSWEAGDALIALAKHDGDDSWFRLAILSSASGRAGKLFAALVDDPAFRERPSGRVLLKELASEIGAAADKSQFTQALSGVEKLADDRLAKDLVVSLFSKPSGKLRSLMAAPGGKTQTILVEILAQARKRVNDESQSAAIRATSLRTLALAPLADNREVFVQALSSRQSPIVQTAALETLGRLADKEIPTIVLEAWPGLSPQVRPVAAETVFSHPAGALAFFDALAAGRISRSDVPSARLELLKSDPDPEVRVRASALLKASPPVRRQEVVAAYQRALTLSGDRVRGKGIFKKECSVCHRLEGVGNEIGADLSTIRNKGSETILLNILDPNREVLPQYLTYIVVTDTGRTVTGMISAESANSITLRRSDQATETILRVNIEELRSTGMSFMPEGLEKQIDVQGMADLLAYLNSVR